ncbi:Oxidoreductase NAD-binding domain-containing protein [Lachnellula occidentalis]|uniref:Oxidoreductase NAD-binding domain-containing protein 1 n=1 Tax=Lachnellula occidentalis TaxID=215460 RepID=A0A8H8RVD2_9HELO|nr:Oxidoreductase NAD-binding domain-containing protein [Lachnellula occidentalis]
MTSPISRSKVSIPHTERTANEPRDNSLHKVLLERIEQVNDDIRLFRLVPADRGKGLMKFLAGQWLDVHVPTIPKAGGFTITSPPSLISSQEPYIELAIQNSPFNPPAAWLWRATENILGSELRVRVGGSFTWPPASFQAKGRKLKRAVFIAGGVGINPLMSMLSQLVIDRDANDDFEVQFLYSTKDPGASNLSRILFLERVQQAFKALGDKSQFQLFLTQSKDKPLDGKCQVAGEEMPIQRRRIQEEDVLRALGPVDERSDTVCYVCGVPGMTDALVNLAQKAEGMDERNVFCEKWW